MKNIKDDKKNKPIKIEYTYSFKVNHSIELLEFLLSKLQMSRNSIKGLLKDHKGLVNGSTETQFNYPLAKDDEVKISKNPQFTNSKNNKIRQNFKFSMPEIIFENKEYKSELENILHPFVKQEINKFIEQNKNQKPEEIRQIKENLIYKK